MNTKYQGNLPAFFVLGLNELKNSSVQNLNPEKFNQKLYFQGKKDVLKSLTKSRNSLRLSTQAQRSLLLTTRDMTEIDEMWTCNSDQVYTIQDVNRL